MQTFLPYPDFRTTAKVLDRQRLGKQRVEVLQLLRALNGQTTGWTNHPAARMWRGYEAALRDYGIAICDEWMTRGYRDTCRDKIIALADGDRVDPPWLGDPAFHASHRSNLLRKAPDHYGSLFSEPDDLPYVWPVA